MEYSQSMLLLLLLVSTVGFFYERSREDMYNQLMQIQQQHHEDQQEIQQQLQQNFEQIQELLQQHNHAQQQLQETMKHVQEELKQQRENNEVVRGGCSDHNIEGVTTMFILNRILRVPCDGYGGIVILRRVNAKHDFPGKLWNDYKQGFGDLSGSFWLGLEHIHQLTSLSEFALLVELEDDDGKVQVARYENVQIMDESSGYRLMVFGYSGNAVDALSYSNGMKFSTIDRDNDELKDINFAKYWKGGWWHKLYCDTVLTCPYEERLWWDGAHYRSAKMTLVMR